ncbi:MAG: DUF1697 domain-containing protein [Patescibacteria group bacterium]|nr:DUF1697 domain-containing protein [Patescibacteria group bacterium]
MTYIALLRGINVGGNNKVPMTDLKAALVAVGCSSVVSYINSGNLVFTDNRSVAELQNIIEAKILATFGFAVKLLIIPGNIFMAIAAALPTEWRNDATMKCDVMFLWNDKDNEQVLEALSLKPGIDTVRYVPGAILWLVDRRHTAKSGMQQLPGTELYRKMTIRNCNTVRKLAQLAGENQ